MKKECEHQNEADINGQKTEKLELEEVGQKMPVGEEISVELKNSINMLEQAFGKKIEINKNSNLEIFSDKKTVERILLLKEKVAGLEKIYNLNINDTDSLYYLAQLEETDIYKLLSPNTGIEIGEFRETIKRMPGVDLDLTEYDIRDVEPKNLHEIIGWLKCTEYLGPEAIKQMDSSDFKEKLKTMKDKYKLDRINISDFKAVADFAGGKAKIDFETFCSDDIVRKTEKLGKELGLSSSEFIRYLEKNKFFSFDDYFSGKNKETEPSSLIVRDIIDYYESRLKKDFGEKEFVVYKPAAGENPAQFVFTKNLAQKMKISGEDLYEGCILVPEAKCKEDEAKDILKDIMKKWTSDVFSQAGDDVRKITGDKIIESIAITMVRRAIEDGYKSQGECPWFNIMFKIQKEEFPGSGDTYLNITQEQRKAYADVFGKIYDLIKNTQTVYMGKLDGLYAKYNINKVSKEFKRCNEGAFNHDKEYYSGIVYRGIDTFSDMRHEFKHEASPDKFGWDEVTPEAFSIFEEFVGIADAGEKYNLSDKKLTECLRAGVEMRMGERSKKFSSDYRHAFRSLMIFRGIALGERPRNEEEFGRMTIQEATNIIKKDLKEYLDTKETAVWFKELERIVQISHVRHAYRPQGEKGVIDYAIDYLKESKEKN